jgi:Glycosyltransferase family 87
MRRMTPTLPDRIVRYGPIVAVLVIGALYAGWQLVGGAPESQDSKAYYYATLDDPYARSQVGGDYAYLYSPAFAQLLAPLRLLPMNVFVAAWTMILVIALAWTAGRLALPLLLFQPVVASIALGNIEILLAAAIVAGFRWPATWSFVLLSKVTPGIGLVWFAVRREWRSLAIALGATAAIVGVSFVLAPQLWFDWFDVLRGNAGTQVSLPVLPGPLWLRMAVGAVIVAWGARTDRRWTVPIGAAIAVPVGWYTLTAIMAVGVAGVAIRTPGFTVRGTILAVTSRILPKPTTAEAPR